MSVDLMMPLSPYPFGTQNLDGGTTGGMNANAGSAGSWGLSEEILMCMAMLERDILAQMQSSTQNVPPSQDAPAGSETPGGSQAGGNGSLDASTRDAQRVAMILQDLLQSLQMGNDDSGAASSGAQPGSSQGMSQALEQLLQTLLADLDGQDSSGDGTSNDPPVSGNGGDGYGTSGRSSGSGSSGSPPAGVDAEQKSTDTSAPPAGSSSSSGSSGTSGTSGTGTTSSSSSTSGATPGGVQFSGQWNTIPFQNKTDQPLTVQLTMGAGQSLPAGVGSNGQFTIPPGGTVNLTFAENGPGFNFKTTTGNGSAWNQGEVTFSSNGSGHSTAFDMSYIYGANSNMNIYSSDGQSSGYQGNLFANVPADAKAGNWGIAPPLSATSPDASGPDAPTDAAAAYLYSKIPEGKGYVGVGKPAEDSTYDDASSLMTNGNLAVVFS